MVNPAMGLLGEDVQKQHLNCVAYPQPCALLPGWDHSRHERSNVDRCLHSLQPEGPGGIPGIMRSLLMTAFIFRSLLSEALQSH